MRLRAQSYHNLDGTSRATTGIPWYWSTLAIVASTMILGGFLMLPITFLDSAHLKVSNLAIGIFAVAILLAGFCATALACIVVHDHYFQATEVFRPALVSCIVGFLTVFYDFIISTEYTWSIPAILLIAVSAIASAIYALLMLWTYRKIKVRSVRPQSIPIHETASDAGSSRYQAPEYYQNYIKNMFPTASTANSPQEPGNITEDEMQRQQMLMLLLKQEQPNAGMGNTFMIEWQDQEHETPIDPRTGTTFVQSAKSLSMKVPGGLKPWDGVWRGVAQPPANAQAFLDREKRRRQIEMGA